MSTEPTTATSAQDPAPSPPAARKKKRFGFLAKLGILFVSLLIATLLAEVMVLLIAGEQPKFPRHVVEAPWGLRYNTPNKSYRHKSADMTAYFRINAQGMREDYDAAYAKPVGVRRIISLGDSFTIGYEVDEAQCFSTVIERELTNSGIKTEVLNCGVSGFGNAEQLVYLERELLKYDPDVVIVSFCGNDLVDNVITGLFRVEDGQLIPAADRYVPAGGLGNFLNSNWFFNILSERSNAFVLVKERLTVLAKRRMVQANEQNLRAPAPTDARAPATQPAEPVPAASDEPPKPKKKDDHQKLLCAAIFERIYEITRERNIPLIIHSIPLGHGTKQVPMTDLFPLDYFDVNRPGIHFISAKELLEPYVGKEQLYWYRSHFHWTPFSHDQTGRAIAQLILDEKLLW